MLGHRPNHRGPVKGTIDPLWGLRDDEPSEVETANPLDDRRVALAEAAAQRRSDSRKSQGALPGV